MSNIVKELVDKKLITPPNWLPDNTHYLTIVGSTSYGCESSNSDMDVYGFCIPTKEIVFPHTAGFIQGFDNPPKFDQYQQHHIKDESALRGRGREYDVTIYSIVRWFALLRDNNPNMVDSIFTAQDCVLHCTNIGHLVRDNRKIFLHKGIYSKMRAYAFSQLSKMSSKDRQGKRKETYDKYGWDLKFGYHLCRLLSEVQQILETGDLDLRKDREFYKAIRRGDLSEQEVVDWANSKDRYLEQLYQKTSLPDLPQDGKIKQLLLDCLESHYGNLGSIIEKPDISKDTLRQIIKLCEGSL